MDTKDAQGMREEYKASRALRLRLKELCEEEIANSYELSQSQYDCPNWQMKQADSVGYKRALEKIISLIL